MGLTKLSMFVIIWTFVFEWPSFCMQVGLVSAPSIHASGNRGWCFASVLESELQVLSSWYDTRLKGVSECAIYSLMNERMEL